MLARAPMSRVELAPSYRASQVRPGASGTMRGATAPTAGSAKCGKSASSHPGPGTQSESRNATSGVSAAARPVFRAAPGPPFSGRRRTRAPASDAIRAIAAGSAEQSSTTITRGVRASPARQRTSSACRSRTGITTVTSLGHRNLPALPGSRGMRDSGIEQATCQRVSLGAPDWGRNRPSRTSTVPPASMREPGSGHRQSPAGASSSAGPRPRGPEARRWYATVYWVTNPASGFSSQLCGGGRRPMVTMTRRCEWSGDGRGRVAAPTFRTAASAASP